MKTNTIMRGYAGLQAFFPTVSKNVQEVGPVNTTTVATMAAAVEADRPRVLAQRNARRARRDAH